MGSHRDRRENKQSLPVRFVNDTKTGGVADTEEARPLIQSDLSLLVSWV